MCDNLFSKKYSLKQQRFSMRELFESVREKKFGFKYPFENMISLSLFNEDIILDEAIYENELNITFLARNFGYPAIKNFFENQKKHLESYRKTGKIILDTLESSELPSDLGKLAHSQNPITFTIGIEKNQNSFYDKSKKQIHIQILSFENMDKFAITGETFDDFYHTDYENAKKIIYGDIKNSFAHELAHWLDDSLHNNAVTNFIQTVKNKYTSEFAANNKLLASYIEVQGYVHDVAEFKKSMSEDEWNKLTFGDLFRLTSLDDAANLLRDTQLKAWKRKIMKRLARENLIGNNMKSQHF